MATNDLKSILKSTTGSIQRTGAGQIGDGVEDFVRGAIKGKPKPPGGGSDSVTDGKKPRPARTWDATSYAAGLVGTDYRPKLKFLFKVEFKFKRSVLDGLKAEGFAHVDLLENSKFTFMVKTVDRPKVDFEYEDDVNQYNFRTKALKRIKHREMTITFMDDVGNRVFEFFRLLMYIHSPVTRSGFARDNTGLLPGSTPAPGMTGMSFVKNVLGTKGTANRSVINSDFGGAIDVIRIKQMFLDNSAADPNGENTVKENIYDFINPRLVSFDLDDLTHDSSDPSLLTMQFDYDWMEMVHNKGISTINSPSFHEVVGKNITGAPADILSGRKSVDGKTGAAGILGKAGGNNPYVNILTGAANRGVQNVTSTAVNRAVKSIAGNGKFATDVGQRLGGVLGGSVSNLTGAASRDFLGSASNSASTGLSNSWSKFKSGFSGSKGAGNAGSAGSSTGNAGGSLVSDSTSTSAPTVTAYTTSLDPGAS
jgi:hypothetical protein